MLRQPLQLAALIAITFAAYFPALRNGFIWDDDRYIEQNMQLRTPRGLERIWLEPLSAEPQYYPLTHTTLWIEYHLWGLRPLGYHLDNILLHAASAVLLWRILRRLNVAGAWVAAAIWAVHPLQVETVAWATERKNVLSGVFYFLALWAFLRSETGRNKWGFYLASLMLFVAAILSKSVASTLPAVILLIAWWKRGAIRRRDVWLVFPMFALGIAMSFLTGWMEKHVVGAIGPEFDFLTPLDRVCIAGRAFWFYLVKLAWPVRLSFIYPHWQVDPLRRPWWILFATAAAGVLGALWLLRGRVGRGPLTAGLFFAGTLVPALGFVNVFPMRYSYVADHFQYLACIGPIVLIAAGLTKVRLGAVRCAVAAIVIVSLCFASALRARIFFDRQTLWGETLAKNPGSSMVHNNYAAALRDAGDIEGAKREFRAALDLENGAMDWVGLGECYAIQGDFATARDMYAKALAAMPESNEPVLRRARAAPYFQLGTAYQGLAPQSPAQSRQYLAQAEENYRRAIDLFPQYGDARKNLAIVLADEQRYPEAIEQCRTILEEDPDSVGALTNLGMIYYEQGQLDSALQQYARVLQIDPENTAAMASIGGILARQGKLDQAIVILNRAIAIDPNNAIARRNLAATMALKSRS